MVRHLSAAQQRLECQAPGAKGEHRRPQSARVDGKQERHLSAFVHHDRASLKSSCLWAHSARFTMQLALMAAASAISSSVSTSKSCPKIFSDFSHLFFACPYTPYVAQDI